MLQAPGSSVAVDAGPLACELLEQDQIMHEIVYFGCIFHTIEQLLMLQPTEPRPSLPSLYDKLIAASESKAAMRQVSLESFKCYLLAEPSLFAVSLEEAVSLQPAGQAFVERYLTLCPLVKAISNASLTPIDRTMPVSVVPQHSQGAYRQLTLRTMLRVKQSQWRAQFTFQSYLQKVFSIDVNKPNKIGYVIKLCRMSIGTDDCGNLSLMYQFLPREPCMRGQDSAREEEEDSYPTAREKEEDSYPTAREEEEDSCHMAREEEEDSCHAAREEEEDSCPIFRDEEEDSCPTAREEEEDSCPTAREEEEDSCPTARVEEEDFCPTAREEGDDHHSV